MTQSTDPPVNAGQYKGNDIDDNGDGQVNDSDTVDGSDAADLGLSTTSATVSVSSGATTTISVSPPSTHIAWHVGATGQLVSTPGEGGDIYVEKWKQYGNDDLDVSVTNNLGSSWDVTLEVLSP